jgi:hypothetical protein
MAAFVNAGTRFSAEILFSVFLAAVLPRLIGKCAQKMPTQICTAS